MIGLYLAALAIVGCPLALLVYALLRDGLSVRWSLDVRPGGDAPPPEPRAPRARTLTHAAPAARARRTAEPYVEPYAAPHPPQTDAHPHGLGTWGTTTDADVAPSRRTGDS